jgi:hypothetical protein
MSLEHKRMTKFHEEFRMDRIMEARQNLKIARYVVCEASADDSMIDNMPNLQANAHECWKVLQIEIGRANSEP